MDTQSVNNTPAAERPRIYSLAVVSLVLSILGVVPFPLILFPVLPLIGPIAGIAGREQDPAGYAPLLSVFLQRVLLAAVSQPEYVQFPVG